MSDQGIRPDAVLDGTRKSDQPIALMARRDQEKVKEVPREVVERYADSSGIKIKVADRKLRSAVYVLRKAGCIIHWGITFNSIP